MFKFSIIILYAVFICIEQEITIKPIYVSLDHPTGFFSYMMILMLLTVQGDIVQQIATKLNDCVRLYTQGIYVHFLFSISLESSTCMPQKLLVHVCIP